MLLAGVKRFPAELEICPELNGAIPWFGFILWARETSKRTSPVRPGGFWSQLSGAISFNRVGSALNTSKLPCCTPALCGHGLGTLSGQSEGHPGPLKMTVKRWHCACSAAAEQRGHCGGLMLRRSLPSCSGHPLFREESSQDPAPPFLTKGTSVRERGSLTHQGLWKVT